MIDDIGSLRIKCINLESEILVLKKELAESQIASRINKINTSTTNEVSNTPRTDAWAFWDKERDIEYVYASVCRNLERVAEKLEQELAEKTISHLEKQHFHHESYCRKCGLKALE